MTPHVQPLLWPYHFAEAAASERAEVEAHLLDCRECLSAYLQLKRELDLAAAPNAGLDARPSAATRERVRAAVARALVPERSATRRWRTRTLRWAVAATAAVATALLLWSGHHPHPSHLAESAWIDTGSDLNAPSPLL